MFDAIRHLGNSTFGYEVVEFGTNIEVVGNFMSVNAHYTPHICYEATTQVTSFAGEWQRFAFARERVNMVGDHRFDASQAEAMSWKPQKKTAVRKAA